MDENTQAKFAEKIKELLNMAKKKKNVLEYQEISDFFADMPLEEEQMEKVLEYLDQNNVDVLRITDDDDVDDEEIILTDEDEVDVENIGGTAALRASVAVENGDAVPITWTTSNPAAATVDPFGLVTAVGDGEALITATTPDGHSACCNVYCGTQVAIQEQIEADEVKIALGVLGGFAVLAGVLALATSGG